MAEWKDIIYHWAPPAIGGVLTIIVGYMIRQAEKRRFEDELAARQFRADMKIRINTIRQQNGWFIRKLIELVTIYNLKFPESHLTVEDYPNGYDDRGET